MTYASASITSFVLACSIAAASPALAKKRESRESRKAVQLQSFREDLFTNVHRKVLESRDHGAHVIYDWNYQESVVDRDAVEGEVAKPARIDTSISTLRKDHVIDVEGEQIDTIQVGETRGAQFAVIFIHGGGGATKAIGGSDINFGGNFNHIQSLVARNGGVYFSPTVNLTPSGDPRMETLVHALLSESPRLRIFIACGSAGSYVCWQLANSEKVGANLGGLILMGGSSFAPAFLSGPAARARVPVLFSHGTKDPLVPLPYAEQYYQAVRSIDRNYPVRFEAFNGGKHGTPIRLLDWKETLEWMFQH